MSNQKERSLGELLSEIRKLKERTKTILPSFTTLMVELRQLPDELERRFWASRVEALRQAVKTDYESFQTKAQKADFLGKFMTVGIDVILTARGMQPIALQNSLRVGISIYQTGKIEPAIIDDSNRQLDVIIVTYEEFAAIVRKLRDQLLKRTVIPTNEDEIPELIYNLASGKK
ncbi:MAG: hypothetical protein FJ025_00305 [Chloroflexi bacterium]|nr:hypothetical protein [Chloroflexota bacterium]